MDKTNSAFECNQNVSVLQIDASSTDEESFRVVRVVSEEPATSKEGESLFGKKKLAEIELLAQGAQHHEEMMIHQLNCMQAMCQQSVQNFRQELSKAYNVELLKLQNENEILRKKLETLELNAQTS